jgi:hypothetical protein
VFSIQVRPSQVAKNWIFFSVVRRRCLCSVWQHSAESVVCSGGIWDVGGGREFLFGLCGPFFLVHDSSYLLCAVAVVFEDCSEELKFLFQ